MSSSDRPDDATRPDESTHPRQPWPGLASYDERLSASFFGREQELRELLRLLERDTVTVLYGRSGVGKSSLLDAGLLPRLRRRGDVPVRVRLRTDDAAPPLGEQCLESVASSWDSASLDGTPPRDPDALWTLLHASAMLARRAGAPPARLVLILDQFEEVLALLEGEQSRAQRLGLPAFMDFLTALVTHEPMSGERSLHPASGGTSYRVIVAFREDRMAAFDQFRQECGILLQNRLRLNDLTPNQALTSVLGAGGDLVDDHIAREIVGYVVGRQMDVGMGVGAEVSAPILSLVCYRLNAQRLARQPIGPRLDPSLLVRHASASSPGAPSVPSHDILEEFYLEAMRSAGPSLQTFVEDELVRGEGVRDLAPYADAVRAASGDERIVRRLVDEFRVLRAVSRNDAPWLELSHDVLVPAVVRSRLRRATEQQRVRQEALLEQERRERQRVERQRTLWRAMSGLLAAALVLALVAGLLAWRASRERDLARDARQMLLVAESRSPTQAANRLLALPQFDSLPLLPPRVLERLGNPVAAQYVRSGGRILAARALPEGPVVVTSTADSSALLWRGSWRGVAPIGAGSLTFVTAAWLTPDAKALVSGHADGSVRLWDLSDSVRLVRQLPGRGLAVRAISANDAGDRIVLTRDSLRLDLWLLPADSTIDVTFSGGAANSVESGVRLPIACGTVSPDGRWLSGSTGNPRFSQVALWAIEPSALRRVTGSIPDRPPGVSLREGWLAPSDSRRRQDQDDGVLLRLPCPLFDPSSAALAVPMLNEGVQVWQLAPLQRLHSLAPRRAVSALGDGDDEQIRDVLRQMEVAELLRSRRATSRTVGLDPLFPQVTALEFPARDLLLLGSSTGEFLRWSVERAAVTRYPRRSAVPVTTVARSASCGSLMATGGIDGTVSQPGDATETDALGVRLAPYGVAPFTVLDVGADAPVESLQASIDCRSLLATYADGSFALWNLDSARATLSWSRSLDESGDVETAGSSLQVVDSAGTIRVANRTSGAVVAIPVEQLFSDSAWWTGNDGRHLAWLDTSRTLRVFTFEGGTSREIARHALGDGESVSFDARLSAMAILRADSSVTVLRLDQRYDSARRGESLPAPSRSLQVGADGSVLAMTDERGRLWLQERAGDSRIAAWTALENVGQVRTMAISSDDRFLVAAGSDGVLRLLDLRDITRPARMLASRIIRPVDLAFSPRSDAIAIAGTTELEVVALAKDGESWIAPLDALLAAPFGRRLEWLADGAIRLRITGYEQGWAVGGAALRRRLATRTSGCIDVEEGALLVDGSAGLGKADYFACLSEATRRGLVGAKQRVTP